MYQGGSRDCAEGFCTRREANSFLCISQLDQLSTCTPHKCRKQIHYADSFIEKNYQGNRGFAVKAAVDRGSSCCRLALGAVLGGLSST